MLPMSTSLSRLRLRLCAAGPATIAAYSYVPSAAPDSGDAPAPSPATVRRPARTASTADSPALAPDGSDAEAAANLTCVPDQLMYVNVSANTSWISLNAGLAFPSVQVQ